jgi:protein gp37
VAETAIEWTHVPGFKGATWNPTTGCDRVSPGCANCYALTMAKRLKAMGQPSYQRDGDPRTSGPGFGLSMHEERLTEPLRWRKPRAVFVNSMSDLFHEEVTDDFLERVFATMGLAPAHIFMVLTKRPERALEFLRDRRWRQFGHSPNMGGKPCFPIIKGEHREGDIPLPNVWLGVSIENARYTWRAEVLREIPAAVRFISAEPLLGSLFPQYADGRDDADLAAARESELDVRGAREGSQARGLLELPRAARRSDAAPAARSERRQIGLPERASARADGASRAPLDLTGMPAVFVKQLGAKPLDLFDDLGIGVSTERTLRLRDRKGGDWDEWPADLRIREFPRSAVPSRPIGAKAASVSWLRIDDGFAEHPKVMDVSDRAFRLHVAAMCFCARNLTDGELAERSVRMVCALTAATKKHVAELVDAGLWLKRDGGAFEVKDFLEYNPTAEKVKADRDAARVRMSRRRSAERSGERSPTPDPDPSKDQLQTDVQKETFQTTRADARERRCSGGDFFGIWFTRCAPLCGGAASRYAAASTC